MAENSKSEKTIKFLANKPLGEDLFENKSQDKIAKVISDNIINDPEFKIIGIDGEWGSGKSNLVRLLEKKLTKTHNFFVYDVWGHQEDEQRKSILVELTEFIKSEPNLLKQGDKKIWDHKLKNLLAKSKETTTINQPYLSIGFIFSLLSIVYIPTVNVFKDSLKDFLQIESWFWKIVLVTFPLIIVVCIYVWNLIGNWRQKKGFCKSFRLSAEETFQVYTNKQKEETRIETISEDQPSVRDFQSWMDDINEDLDKKVVIVFDNFDRLPKKHILNIWSSIHIFFAEKAYSNIKVIIPFDREHIQNAFKELNAENKKFGDDYVNKTFDIVFRVTLPIMSNWKKFFQSQWKNAFPNFDEEELRLVIQVYEFLGKRITPREIIGFINEIMTIKLLDNDFKERYIAIFVLKKDEILQNPLLAITALDYLGGLKSIYDNDPDFAKQLTGIIYHIDVEEAIELIYTQELKEALNKNDREKFNSICKSSFADSIFSSAIIGMEVFENPIITLSQIDSNTSISPSQISQAWNTFYYNIVNKELTVEKLAVEDWQLLLLENNKDNQYLQKLLIRYSKLIDESSTLLYISLIDRFIEVLSEERILPLLPSINLNPENLIQIIQIKGDYYQKYQISTKSDEIDSYMSKLLIDDILKLTHTDTLCNNFELSNYRKHLELNLVTAIDQNNAQKVNNIFLKIKETTNSESSKLENLLEDSKIYSFYVNNASSLLPVMNEFVAQYIAKGVKFNSSYTSAFKTVMNSDDELQAIEIADTILNYISYDNLLLSSVHFKESLLFKKIILSLFSNSPITKVADIYLLIDNYKTVKESLGFTNEELLRELDEWEVDKEELEINKLDDLFIEDCFKNNQYLISKCFIDKFNSEFIGFSDDQYIIVFSKDSNIHFKYFEFLLDDSLTQSSLDIFKTHLIEKIDKGEIDEKWWKVLRKYESNNSKLSITDTLKDIRDQFLNNQIELDLITAKEILPLFIKYNILESSSDNFRTIIKNGFLNDGEFIDFLLKNNIFIKNLYQNTSSSQKEGFRNIINEKRGDNSKLEDLAKYIGIRKARD